MEKTWGDYLMMLLVKRAGAVALLTMALGACGVDDLFGGGSGGGGGRPSGNSDGGAPEGGSGGAKKPPRPVSDMPASDAEAARFLAQATFGPTPADIAHLRKIGYSRWLDEQMDPVQTPVTRVEPHVRSIPADAQNYAERRNYWLWRTVHAKDQLRMRMGFALSQIFVVSDRDYHIKQVPRIANYQDMLAVNAFGDYRDVLEKVTLHPAMALYLSYMFNRKAFSYVNSEGQTVSGVPDENYGREIMQLFSIGLVERNPDFSLKTDANGNPIPTYDQDVVAAMARVFTGWTWSGNDAENFWRWAPDGDARPMRCHSKFHDDQPKRIFRGIVIDTGSDCKAALAQTLDALAAHPNVAPFIGRQLIQRFVTSNPSPAYVARVSKVWTGSNGNFGKVIRAILLDPEARHAPAESDAGYGKAREPLIQVTTFWRAFGAKYSPHSGGHYYFKLPNAWDFTTSLGQDSLRSPSVFNFFEPDHRLPSSGDTLGLYAPEFQLYNEASFIDIFNQQYFANNNAPDKPWSWGWAPRLDMSSLLKLANAGDHEGMVNEINTLLFAGTLPTDTRKVMIEMLNKLKQTKRDGMERTRSLVQLALATPEFVIQR